ncbi:MAG: CRISPR-associated helicase Cas3' [Campylobacterota bacterium]|nr:CRISPR-associated helicase Cas3' [Campylobacterota bacterium]
MFDDKDTTLEREVKRFHDIAKLKDNFQVYIRDTSKGGKDKNHSLLSAYLFLLNSNFETKEALFGFLAIASHHGNVENFFALGEDNRYIGKHSTDSKELDFLDEVISYGNSLEIYTKVEGELEQLEIITKNYRKYLRKFKFKNRFDYSDFIAFKKLYASLIYSDKYEAIFGVSKESKKEIPSQTLKEHIDTLEFNQKRDDFRKFVLHNFDNSHKLFTLTAPTGYGKTLTALEFALKFNKDKIIFALPFTSIIDQAYDVVSDIFKESEIDIFKVHHKTDIDESVDEDRYSQVKFLMSSFSGEINITTLYQIIFSLFGNSNKDNVKFNQFKNAIVIIDEAQAIPYAFRSDFIKLCELISEQMNTVFIFMSATMPILSNSFREISNLDYFKKQNRYILKWLSLENGQDSLIDKIEKKARQKHTLVVVNTIKKAQELYLDFKDNYECYSLNGYMTDSDKQKTIQDISERLQQHETKILLISTQSIEAGIDLDFEVGFREVAPISSIIQTAGRVNRHFGEGQSTLYIFDDICEYSDLIYGDLQLISQSIFELLQNGDIEEENILELSQLYFEKIKNQLENLLIEKEIEKLEFATIYQKIENIMDEKKPKQLIIIEPYDGFIKEIEEELLDIKKSKLNKFRQKDLTQSVVKKLLKFGVNVVKKEIDSFSTPIGKVKYLYEMIYLPCGAEEYSYEYGVKKYRPDEVKPSDIGFDL